MKKFILYILIVLSFPLLEMNAEYWQKIENLPSGYDQNYYLDIYFLPSNPNYGWACGFNSKILRTTDRGKTWQGVTISNSAFHLESIHFPNQNVGYCSGVQGIFKSIDGGANWRDISDPRMGNLWGCYFYNENIGIAVGEGCLDNIQKFWRTEDGGNTWTLSTTNEINSGMTDLILYSPNGLGYAVGSGKLYVTYDGGRNWEKYRDTEVDNIDNRWHEEITHYGGSFLLPLSGINYGGSSCQGGGYGGGMYFTTDSGSTWAKAQTTVPMYGTFLLDEQRGWACGYSGLVCYTDDAGQNWHIKNCGIFDNDLDDIWFINENEAWLAGRGIWRLSNDEYAFVPDTLYVKGVCFPEEKIDTIYFYNQSFNSSSAKFSITNDPENSFSIVYPPDDNSLILPPCGMIKVFVKFKPSTRGYKSAYLMATVNDTVNIFARLEGFSSNSTIIPNKTLVDFDTVYANSFHTQSVQFTATYPGESIIAVETDTLNISFTTDFTGRKDVGQIPYNLNFYLQAKDTGYIEKEFTIKMLPCNKDTIIKVCAYVKSSIINSQDTIITLNCPPLSNKFISIPIYNSGNADLNIDKITISNNYTTFVGFTSGRDMPTSLKINERDSILLGLNLNPQLIQDTFFITIENNDSTRYYNYTPVPLLADGKTVKPKNPYDVRVITRNWYSLIKMQAKDTSNFKVCFGDSIITSFIVQNLSFSGGNYIYSFDTVNCNFKTVYRIDKDFPINSGEVLTYTLYIYPKHPGEFSLKLKFKSAYCDDVDSLSYNGVAEDIKITSNPTQINITKKTKNTDSLYITLDSRGFGMLTLDSIGTTSTNNDINFDYSSTPKINFIDSTSYLFELIINTKTDGTFNDTLVFYFSGLCPKTYKIPVYVKSSSNELSITNTEFESIFCEITSKTSNIKVVNYASEDFMIGNISIDNPAFKLGDINFPILVPSNGFIDFTLTFTPIDTGYSYVTVKIYGINGDLELSEIKYYGFYGLTNVSLSKYLLDLDSIEYCDPIIYDTITVYNDGNIDSDIQIINNAAGISLSTDVLNVPAFSYKEVIIAINPAEIDKIGESDFIINFIDLTCDSTYEYKINLFKIHKEIAISPTVINFKDIWANIPNTDVAKVENKSNVPIVIKSVSLIGNGSQFITFTGISPNDILNIDEIRNIYFTLNAPEFAQIDANFEITYYSNCDNLNNIKLNGNIAEEVYNVKIYSEEYRQRPNDNFDINIKIDGGISKSIPIDSINFILNYNRKLSSPQLITYNGKIINYIENHNDIIFTLSNQDAHDFLTLTNQTIKINSIAMISIPDTTTLDITRTKIFAKDKKINIDYDNGFLTIYDYCIPIGKFSEYEVLNATAKIDQVNDKIIINYSSSNNINLQYQLIDNLGRIIVSEYLPPSISGSKTIENNITNGIYFVIVKYNNQIINQKLVMSIK